MKHNFKIVDIPVEPSIEMDKLPDITDENMKCYRSYGVWILFGRKKESPWRCLQVGQSSNIASEIISDVKCLSGEIKVNKDRIYINQFGNVVEGYTYDVYLSPREQIYKKIGEEYHDFIFVCICCGEGYKDSIKAIEKYVAWKFRALFWRNGRAFTEAKENVTEPDSIDGIAFNKKENVDSMVKWYNKQLKDCK